MALPCQAIALRDCNALLVRPYGLSKAVSNECPILCDEIFRVFVISAKICLDLDADRITATLSRSANSVRNENE